MPQRIESFGSEVGRVVRLANSYPKPGLLLAGLSLTVLLSDRLHTWPLWQSHRNRNAVESRMPPPPRAWVAGSGGWGFGVRGL